MSAYEGELEGSDFASELDAFRSRYPVDDRAWAFLLDAPRNVQEAVVKDFRPKREGEADYSALLVSFAKKIKPSNLSDATQAKANGVQIERSAYVPPAAMPQRQHRMEMHSTDLSEELEEFRMLIPMDDKCFGYLASSPPDVQARVIRDFRPKREGESDYSALVIGFVKRCRDAVKGPPPRVPQQSHQLAAQYAAQRAQYEAERAYALRVNAFWRRYPADENAISFVESSPEVLDHVMHTFRPPREGESDYSALLVAVAKKFRSAPAPVAARHVQWAPRVPVAPVVSRAVIPRPPAPAYRRPDSRRPPQSRLAEQLQDFRSNYPMDDKAFEYLSSSSPEVCMQVLEKFAPKQERGDNDFSAPVITFTKRVRSDVAASTPMQPPVHVQRPRIPSPALPAYSRAYGYPATRRPTSVSIPPPPLKRHRNW